MTYTLQPSFALVILLIVFFHTVFLNNMIFSIIIVLEIRHVPIMLIWNSTHLIGYIPNILAEGNIQYVHTSSIIYKLKPWWIFWVVSGTITETRLMCQTSYRRHAVHNRLYILLRTDSTPPVVLRRENFTQPLPACSVSSYTDGQVVQVQYTAQCPLYVLQYTQTMMYTTDLKWEFFSILLRLTFNWDIH